MSNIRLIPRLDIKGPNVVKGIQLEGFRVLGTAEMFAEFYYHEGADEILYQDTVASLYQREICLDIVKRTADKIFVPLTVAGGIRTTDEIREILRAGADKVAINTGAVAQPELLKKAVHMFGAQCIVASLEVYRHTDGRLEIWTDYGRQPTGIDAIAWAHKVVELGVGEILLTSINNEGTGRGFDLEMLKQLSSLPVPVIASGGAGSAEDLVKAVKAGADAVSAASIFHNHYANKMHPGAKLKGRYPSRNGDETDTGNVDFLHVGYGGMTDLMTQKVSVPQAKKIMRESGLSIRDQIKEGHAHA